MKSAAVAVVLLAVAALPALAQRPGSGRISRVPPGGPRIGPTRVPAGNIAPERYTKPIPFKGPIELPPADRQWINLVTPHFNIISSAGEHQTRIMAEDLERLTAVLTRANPRFRVPPIRTRVFLFAQRKVGQRYFDAVRGLRVDATGITYRHSDGNTMLLDGSAGGGEVMTPRHELVHDLLCYRQHPLPLWVEEGLAEYYSNAGLSIPQHVTRIRTPLRIPLAEMFAMRADSPRSASFDFYAQSWAAVTTLMRRDARGFFSFLDQLDRGTSPEEALRSTFRMSLRDFETSLRKAGGPARSVLLEEVAPIPVEVHPVERGRLLYELGDLLARVPGRADEAVRHLTAAVAAGADDPQTAASLGLSHLAQNDPAAALPHLERASRALPDRTDVAFALFTVYMGSGERASADSLFPQLVSSPRVNDARRILLLADTDRADALARDGKLQEAAEILRELALKMPGKTRIELEAQAVGLEKMASRE